MKHLATAGLTALVAFAACNHDTPQPKTPDKDGVQAPAPSKHALTMGAPRLCSGHQLIAKLVAQGPLPPVDDGTKPGVLAASAKASGAKGDEFQTAYEKAAPQIVYIVTTKKNFYGFVKGSGTGELVDDKGHVLTNYHVVATGKQDDFSFKTTVFFGHMEASGRMVKDETPHEGTVVKVDPIRDLALIEVSDVPKGLGHMKLADKDPKPGQPVAAIGHGNVGLLWTMKGCQVGAIGERKDLVDPRGDCDQYVDESLPVGSRSAMVERCKKDVEDADNALGSQVGGQGLMVQTDCGISHGDSGGPLIDASGGLVGVNEGIAANGENADNGRHIHVGEVREFLQSIPAIAAHELPDPWCAGLENDVEDVDLDGQIDLERTSGAGEYAYFFDLDEDTFGKKPAGPMPFDAEVALQGTGDARYAWYDTDNDGRFDLMLQGGMYSASADKAYRIGADGALREDKDAEGGFLLDAKYLGDAAMAPRFAKLAASVASDAANPATGAPGEIVVPDPIWGGGRSGTYSDGDGDGKPDSVRLSSRWSSGWLFDSDQDTTGAIASDADLQKLVNARGIHAELAVVQAPGYFWAFYDTNGDGEHDVALATPPGGFGATLSFRRAKGGSWTRTGEHLGRKLFRPKLVAGSDRLARLLAPLFDGVAADDGLGSFPDPKLARFSLASAQDLHKRVAYGFAGYAEMQLVDVDGDSKLGGDIGSAIAGGGFKADFGRVANEGYLWSYYDGDGDGVWDAVIFGESAEKALAGYRVKNGAVSYDADLAKGGLYQPSLFSGDKQKGASELFAKLYGG